MPSQGKGGLTVCALTYPCMLASLRRTRFQSMLEAQADSTPMPFRMTSTGASNQVERITQRWLRLTPYFLPLTGQDYQCHNAVERVEQRQSVMRK